MTKQIRGRDYADLLIMCPEHYAAYDAATIAIQRQTNETSLGKLGFSALEYIGGGKRAEIVLDGGIGTQHAGQHDVWAQHRQPPPALSPEPQLRQAVRWRWQMPIDKDAIAQFIGWMGELTMVNPLFNWRLYDSVPAS